MVSIHFRGSKEAVSDLESKGYTVYDSGESVRDLLVETVNGEGQSLVSLLEKYEADPMIQEP
jgi:hypothetical protein